MVQIVTQQKLLHRVSQADSGYGKTIKSKQ